VTRTAHIAGEFARSLGRHPFTALGSLLSLTLLYLLFDLYWIGAATVEQVFARAVAEVQMEVFVREEVAEGEVAGVQAEVAAIPGVTGLQYISKEAAREIMQASLGMDLLAGYDTLNPLPRSFVLTFAPAALTSDGLAAIAGELRRMPAVADLYYNAEWLRKTEGTQAVILRVGLALGILILVTAVISSLNNLRLMIRTRAEGLAQMSLLGASRLFLVAPMLLEGAVLGGAAAAIGWAALWYARGQVSFTHVAPVFPPLAEIAGFCLGAALLGVVSGYLGVRRMLA